MGTWTRSDGKALNAASANNTVWNYCDENDNVLFSLKGIKNPTAEGNGDNISVNNGVVTITNAAFYDTSTTSYITLLESVNGYGFKFADDVPTTNTFKKLIGSNSTTTYSILPGAVFYLDTKTYEISTAAQLAALATCSQSKNFAGMTFKLTEDITDWTGVTFASIGNSVNKFAGTFDGGIYDAEGKLIGNHTIAGLSIKGSDYQGLFGATGASAIIQNVTLSGVTVNSNGSTGYVGALVGNATGGSITNCVLTGDVTVKGTNYVGGLIGSASSSAVITNCYIDNYDEATRQLFGTVNVSASGYVGALVGYATSVSITNCNLTGNATVEGTNYVGGLIGSASSSAVITNCDIDNYDEVTRQLLGTVTVTSTTASATGIGGLIGYVQSSNTIVKGCDITGSLSISATKTSTDVGGLIGSNKGTVGGESADDGCTVRGDITVTGVSNVGGLIGKNTATAVTNCIVSDTIGEGNNAVDFGSIMIQGTGDKVGGLIGENGTGAITSCIVTGTDGEGDNNGVTVTSSKGGNIGGLVGFTSGSSNNITINNCTVSGDVAISGTTNVGGLVGNGNHTSASVYNSSVNSGESGIITVTGSGSNVGGLIGSTSGIVGDESANDGCNVSGNVTVTGTTNVGGLVGLVNYTSAKVYHSSVNSSESGAITVNGTGAMSAAKDTVNALIGKTSSTKNGDNSVNGNVKITVANFTRDQTDTTNSTYLIQNVDEFKAFADLVNGGQNCAGVTFKLTNNINLSELTDEYWTPIGNADKKFQGTFDGDNHTISGLKISASTANQGLFGYISGGATVKNVNLSGVNVSGSDAVGGVVGYATGSSSTVTTIENCTVSGSINGTGTYFGGIVGQKASTTYVTVTDCVWEINNGDQFTTFADSVNQNANNNCAGITVKLTDNITLESNTSWTPIGSASTTAFVGTFDGNNQTISGLTITNSASNQGLFGYTNNATIKNVTLDSVNINVNGNLENIGAVVGYAAGSNGSIEKCTVNATQIKITTTGTGVGSIVGKNDGAMSDCTVNVADDAFEIKDSGDFAIDKTGAYLIKSETDLIKLATNVNKGNKYEGMTFKLANNITLDSNTSWTPIGTFTSSTSNKPFSGTFDGNGKSISGLTISNSNNNQGLFGYTKNATIKNLTLENVYVSGGGSTGYVGALVGYAADTGTIENCTLSGGTINGTVNTGGLVGNSEGTITGCTISGTVTVKATSTSSTGCVGGLVGTTAGVVTDCTVNGNLTVDAKNKVGGFIGEKTGTDASVSVSGCTMNGTITVKGTSTYVGGLIGQNASTISNCKINENNASGTLTVTSTSYNVGGLVGYGTGGGGF